VVAKDRLDGWDIEQAAPGYHARLNLGSRLGRRGFRLCLFSRGLRRCREGWQGTFRNLDLVPDRRYKIGVTARRTGTAGEA
jgi:hypothetical protein